MVEEDTKQKNKNLLGRDYKGRFVKGAIPWNSHNLWYSEHGYKNYCRSCGAEIPMLNRGGDFQSYCNGHSTLGKKFPNAPRGENHHSFKKRRKHQSGYWLVYKPEHPRAIYDGGHVLEHIVIAEEMLGRPLRQGEVVNHKNRIRDDNRPENLEIFDSHSDHMKQHVTKGDTHKFDKVVEGSRRCVDCGSTVTKMIKWKGGLAPEWISVNREQNQWRCKRCYMHIYDSSEERKKKSREKMRRKRAQMRGLRLMLS